MITGDKITRFESSIYGIDSFEGLAEKWYDGSPKVFFVINKIANLNFNIV